MRKRGQGAAAVLLLTVTATSGCDGFLDVNDNPNAPTTAPVEIRLPAVLATFSSAILGSWPAKMSAEWMQHVSFNSATRGFARYDRYEMRDVDAGTLWDLTYATVLYEAKSIYEEAGPREEWAYSALAKIMYAWTLSVATDVWGPIPMTEALDPFNRTPSYDDQKTVYEEIHRLLTEAIDELQRPNFPTRVPAANDLLYQGELNRWLRLANTLQAQLHLRLVNAPGENRTDRAQKALASVQNGFTSILDDANFRYGGSNPVYPQPWNVARTIPAYRVSHFFAELLKARNDPRLPIMADRATADIPATVYRGHRNGDPPGPEAQFSRVANFFAVDTMPFTWIGYADAKFIEAEARLIVSGAAAADAAYRAAIRAHMEKLRVSTANINTYVNARPALNTVANPLQEIIREKFVANYLKFEAWNDWRRTGFPVLQPVPGALTNGIPQRFPTPSSELAGNAANAQATGIPPGLAGMTVKVWWASQGSN
jgi:hypothetical protein